MLFLMIFCFGAGIYVNTAAGASFLVTFLTYISPLRYSTELLMRRILAGKMGGDYKNKDGKGNGERKQGGTHTLGNGPQVSGATPS